MTIHLAVEEDTRDMAKYKQVHAAGCRDLRDPEPVDTETRAGLLEALDGHGVTDEEEDLQHVLAPCAKKIIKEAQS